jgi:hypothetical protein
MKASNYKSGEQYKRDGGIKTLPDKILRLLHTSVHEKNNDVK